MMTRWDIGRSHSWYLKQPWLFGFNYVPSYACNTTEWWQEETFESGVIDRELGWASEIGYNTTRVFVQYLVWKHNPDAFKKRFNCFLDLAARHGISVMPVLFDDCAFGEPPQLDPYLGKQREPIPGIIMPCWTPSPGRKLAMEPGEKTLLKSYILDMLNSFSRDDRVLMWDLFNEPMNAAATGTPSFLLDIFSWARQTNVKQPLTSGIWNDNQEVNEFLTANSDILTFHFYTDHDGMSKRISELRNYGRPVICTEWMARVKGSCFETELPLFFKEHVGCYQWGLVNGKTQCQFPWWNKPGGEIDSKTGWFHDIMHQDGTPYRQQELEVIRKFLEDTRLKVGS